MNRHRIAECASIVQWQLACNNLLHGPEAGAQRAKTTDPSSLRSLPRARAHGRSHRPLQPTSDRELRSRSAPGFAGWRCLMTTSWFTNRPSVLPGDGLAPRARTSCSVGRCLHSCRTPFGLRPSAGGLGPAKPASSRPDGPPSCGPRFHHRLSSSLRSLLWVFYFSSLAGSPTAARWASARGRP